MHRLQESESMKRLIISLITASVSSACTLAPHYRRPESRLPDRWPSDIAAGNTTGSADASASGQPSRSGIGDPYLATLDAQRSLYAAEQQLVAIRQAELANQVTLYKVLGGGWAQHTA